MSAVSLLAHFFPTGLASRSVWIIVTYINISTLENVHLTVMGAYIQARTHPKIFAIFFYWLIWMPYGHWFHAYSSCPPLPPLGGRGPLFGQNGVIWRGNKKWLSWKFYHSKKIFSFDPQITQVWVRFSTSKFFGSGYFLIRQVKKAQFSLGSLKWKN